jgi:hypothetical protein
MGRLIEHAKQQLRDLNARYKESLKKNMDAVIQTPVLN